MKKMETAKVEKLYNGNLPQGMQDLTFEEKNNIRGGESVWQWIGFTIGKIGKVLSGS